MKNWVLVVINIISVNIWILEGVFFVVNFGESDIDSDVDCICV